MNPKDIPFLSFWIISTYILCKIIQKLHNDETPSCACSSPFFLPRSAKKTTIFFPRVSTSYAPATSHRYVIVQEYAFSSCRPFFHRQREVPSSFMVEETERDSLTLLLALLDSHSHVTHRGQWPS